MVSMAVVDPGFTKGGGHKIRDLLSLLPHIYKINKTTRWEVVKNSASPKRPFFFRLRVIFPIFIAFPVQIVKQNIPFHPFFGHNFLCFIVYLRPHPPLIQKGGHTLHAYSFSYWDTPTSHQKGGGGMCLKCPPPLDPPMNGAKAWMHCHAANRQ